MPKYTNERLTEFKLKGYMTFMRYEEFKQHHATIAAPKDQALDTFLFFTGSRPGEATLIQRKDVRYENSRIYFSIPTLKRKDKFQRPLEYAVATFPELLSLWDYCKEMPDDFYLFGWLKSYHNPRDYIREHLGLPAYFFRHNLVSLGRKAGLNNDQLMLLKGSKDPRSITPYIHLDEEQTKAISRRLSKGILA
jgi:integrase